MVCTGRTFDLGSKEWGRDGTFVSLPAPVTVSTTGLSPWQSGDSLDLYSLNAGAFGYIYGSATGRPLAGATSLSGLSFDYANMLNPVLLDSGLGDVFSLAQMRLQTSANGVPYRAMHKVLDTGMTQVAGQPVTVSGTFIQPVAPGTFAVDWRRSAFEARRTRARSAPPYTMSVDIRVAQEALPAGHEQRRTTATRVAALHMEFQSVYLPLGVLQAGQTYFAEIQSGDQPGSDLATSPFKRSLPRGRASVLTGMFSP